MCVMCYIQHVVHRVDGGSLGNHDDDGAESHQLERPVARLDLLPGEPAVS